MSDQFEIRADKGLLPQVAQGIEKAMEHCVSKYGGLVWSIARRYAEDTSTAEDIVQETFTDLWKSAARFDPRIATESTFVGLLARRRAIDFVRKENRRPQLEPLPEAGELTQATPDTPTTTHCESQDVREALKKLPEETQQIFALHFDGGMTHPEIADKTGLPLGTIKTRLRRGLIEMRNILRRHDDAQSPASAKR